MSERETENRGGELLKRKRERKTAEYSTNEEEEGER